MGFPGSHVDSKLKSGKVTVDEQREVLKTLFERGSIRNATFVYAVSNYLYDCTASNMSDTEIWGVPGSHVDPNLIYG